LFPGLPHAKLSGCEGKKAAKAVLGAGEPGDGWSVVRRNSVVVVAIAAALLSVTGFAVAGDKDKPATKSGDFGPIPSRIIQMQTAFNPALPGSGEGVRIFTRTVKHMSGGTLAIKIVEPGRITPTADMLDAVIAGDLEAAFTWSGYAAAKAPVFGVFATVPFGPSPEDMTSWMLEGDGSRIHREAYEKLGVVGIPCGIQGAKGGGWFRTELNTVADFKGQRLRFGRYAGEVVAKLGATQVPLPPGEFFYKLQQGQVDGGEMSTPAIDAALGFDKLGLPYYMPGWQQPSAVLDFLMRKDKWETLSPMLRIQVETACRANIAWMLSRSPHLQGLAMEKLKESGVVIKEWSPDLLKVFRAKSEIVLKEQAERDPDFAAALANQRAFIGQSTDWRKMSRLP
jgi:TRAP-type mannitol/chloroaromatic compound transport system substrate-binding protein